MKLLEIIILLAVMAGVIIAVAHWASSPWKAAGGIVARAINNAGTHESVVSRIAEGAIATPHLLVKIGTAPGSQVIVSGAAEEPIGAAQDDAEDAARVAIELLGKGATRLLIASEAITAGENVYTAANGKIQDEPASAGTYYWVGTALTAATTDGDEIEVETIKPVKVVVIAALTSTNGTAAAASANLANLAAEAEKIGDDVRAIGAALATPALVKVLSA